MQCPVCGQLRYKRDWMPSQWKKCNPKTNEHGCCRQCDPQCIAPAIDRSAEVNKAIDAIIVLMRTMSSDARNRIGRFIVEWMSKLSHAERKNFSYYGAIHRRNTTDPLGRTIATVDTQAFLLDERRYFDPGNLVYSYAFRALWDNLYEEYQWSEETMGDIIEGIMGYCYLTALHGRKVLPGVARLSHLLEELSYNVWRILVYSVEVFFLCKDFYAFAYWVRCMIWT